MNALKRSAQKVVMLFILSAVILFTVILQQSCKKTELKPTTTLNPTEFLNSIKIAKNYFENNVQNIDTTKSSNGGTNPISNFRKMIDWTKSYVLKSKVGDVVVVPIGYKETLYARPNLAQAKTRLPINNISKLLIYKDASQQFHAEVATYFPDSNNTIKNFSGFVDVKDWQGNSLITLNYANGSVFKLAPSGSSQGSSTTNNSGFVANVSVPITTCNYIDWYTCIDDNCDFSYTQDLGCLTSTIDYQDLILNYGYIAPSSYYNGNSVNSLLNNLTTPCFVSVLNSLSANGLKNQLSSILQGVANSGDVLNINFKESTTLPAGTDAYTTCASGNGADFTISITLNTTVLQNASNQFIAETMFHEILHAYFFSQTSVNTPFAQHCEMIQNYVAVEENALMEIFPTLSAHDAVSIILGGMADVQEYDPATLNTVLAGFNLTSTDVINTNNSYKSGAKGTKCNTSSTPCNNCNN
jgi:hypothetical protein